ncbi:MAG TPA: hypothetical protein VF171_04870 [Trueperaceae bacterium]
MEDSAIGLRELLGETGAYREGHFCLPDGQHVLSYYNCERLFQYPALASRAADHLVTGLGGVEADFVFSPSISSLVLAFEISRRTGWQFVLHSLPFTAPNYRFPADTRLLVVEDVVVAGKSLEHAQMWCEQRGGKVVAQAVLVDRRPEAGGSFDGIPLHSGIRDEVRVYAPENCPACRDGVPVVQVEPNYPQRVS